MTLLRAVADSGLEGVLYLVLYYKYDGLEPRAPRVVYRVVDYELAVVPHGVKLLEPAVTAAHTGGHDDKNRFVHIPYPPKIQLWALQNLPVAANGIRSASVRPPAVAGGRVHGKLPRAVNQLL